MAKETTAAIEPQTGGMPVTPFGEDLEALEPAEEALMEQGNEAARAAGGAESPETASAPPSARGAERERRSLSDEEVHKFGPNDSVPAWSLVRERQENRDLKRRLEEMGRKLGSHEERWQRLSERLNETQRRGRPTDPEPDPKADPAGYQNWQHRQALAAQTMDAQRAAARRALIANYEQQYVLGGHRDYQDRVNFVRERRERELALMGYTEARERNQILRREIEMLIDGALRSGRNPAEVVHSLADQWGFQGAAGDRLADLARKQVAAQSLQTLAARPPSEPLTLQDVADMDDEAYDRYLEKAGGDLAALLRR